MEGAGMEWTAFETLAAIAALFLSIGVPVIRLNSSITKLTVMLERVERDVESNRRQIAAQKEAARASHEKLWRHSEEQDERLNDHETRIQFLEKARGGKGILLGGVPGVKPAKVFVIGGGVVGTAAAVTAAGIGADVTICDISLPRLTYLADVMPKNVKTLMSSEYNIRQEIKQADLIVGSVLIPGAKAPKLVTKDMLKDMAPGTVMVDVAIDQGGCFETSKPTTHENPTYYVDGILHYCVANIPGAVPYTSTLALTNATLPYAIQLADKGWEKACRDNAELKAGLNIIAGKVVHKAVAEAWGLEYTPLEF